MPITQNSANLGARWGVMWSANGRYITKEFDDDLQKAVDFHATLVATGRKASLRCMNVGIPPPKRITEHQQVDIRIKSVNGKKKKVKTVSYVDLMHQYNEEGYFWCPYCIKVRVFKQEQMGTRIVLKCPACGISTRDGHVRRYNPKANLIDLRRSSVRGRPVRRRA